MLQRKGMENTRFKPTVAGHLPCLHWLMTPFSVCFFLSHPANRKHLLSGYLCYLGISQQLSNTLKELPIGYQIVFWHSNSFPTPFSSAQQLTNNLEDLVTSAIGKSRAISVHFPWSNKFIILYQLKVLRKIVNTLIGSFPDTDLFNNIAFS